MLFMGKKDGVRFQELDQVTQSAREQVSPHLSLENPLLPTSSLVHADHKTVFIPSLPSDAVLPTQDTLWQTFKSKIRSSGWEKGLAGISGAIGSLVYAIPSFYAAAAIHPLLAWPAALSSQVTNTVFNTEALLNLMIGGQNESQLFDFLSVKDYSILFSSLLSAFFCVLPAYFMAITGSSDNPVTESEKVLQSVAAVILMLVNFVGSKKLIEAILTQIYSQDRHRVQAMQQIQGACNLFLDLPDNKKTDQKLTELLLTSPKQRSTLQKIIRYPIQTGLVLVASTQWAAFVLLSYFGTKEFVANNWAFSESASTFAGSLAGIGNAIPSAGFLYMGITLLSSILLDDKWSFPSPAMGSVLFLALFSGFAATQGMKLTLDYLHVEDAMVPMFQMIANASAVFEYNLPAVILFFRRFSDRYKRLSSAEIQILQQSYFSLLEKSAGTDRVNREAHVLMKELVNLLSLMLKSEEITEELKESVSILENKQNMILVRSRRNQVVTQNLAKYGQFRLSVESTSSGDQPTHQGETTDDAANCQLNRDSVSYFRR
jgi:hypothetical protein